MLSGITATRYVVESAEQRQRREQRAEWERFASARAELVALRAEAASYRSTYGPSIAAVPAAPRARPTSSVRRLQAATAEVQATLARHRPLLRESVAAAAQRDVGRLLAAAVTAPAPAEAVVGRPAGSTSVASATRPDQQTQDQQTQDQQTQDQQTQDQRAQDQRAQQRRADLVRRAGAQLARLPADTPDRTRSACEQAVAEIGTTGSEARVRLLLEDLAQRVRRAGQASERAAAARRALQQLAARLEAVTDGSAAGSSQVQAELDAALAEPEPTVPDGLAARVAGVVEQADRAHRRRVVAAALSVSLADLGYQVAEGFETVLAGEGVAYAAMPKAEGYGLKVLLDRGQDTIRTQVVRSAAASPDPSGDAAAEQTFCDEYGTLLGRLRRHGVDPTALAATPPGQVPVQRVTESVLPAAAAHHDIHQEREQPL
jgi:hypothetical protein